MAAKKFNYELTQHKGGFQTAAPCTGLTDIYAIIRQILVNTPPGQSVNITITKKHG